MQRVNEADGEYRNGDWGVKYFVRGPRIDWGVIRLPAGQEMAEHGHREVEETFYCLEGAPTMIVSGEEIQAEQGDIFRLEARERHDIRNDSSQPVKIIFIKTPYLPEDKT